MISALFTIKEKSKFNKIFFFIIPFLFSLSLIIFFNNFYYFSSNLIDTSDAIKYIYYSENFYQAYLEEYKELSVRVLFPFIINLLFLLTSIDVEIIYKLFSAIIFILINILTLNFLKIKFDNYLEIFFWYIFLLYSNVNIVYSLYNPYLLSDIFIYFIIISFIISYYNNFIKIAFLICIIAPFAKEYFIIFSILGISCLYNKRKNRKIIYYSLLCLMIYSIHYYFAGSQYSRTERGFIVFIDFIFNQYFIKNFIIFLKEKAILFLLLYFVFCYIYFNKINQLKSLLFFPLFLFLITSFNYEHISGSNYFRVINPGIFLLVLIVLNSFKMKEINFTKIFVLILSLFTLVVEYFLLILSQHTSFSEYFFSNRISNIFFIIFNFLVLFYLYLKKRSLYV